MGSVGRVASDRCGASPARRSCSQAAAVRRSSPSASSPAACASSTSASSRSPRPSPARRVRRRAPARAARGPRPSARGPARRARAGTPSSAGRALLLGLLHAGPTARAGRPRASASANTCGWRRTSLAMRSAATSSTSNGLVGVLLAMPRVEHHLQQQVAELLAQARAVVGLDRLGELVRLLERVRHERLVRLLGVPRAAARRAQAVHDAHELAQSVGLGHDADGVGDRHGRAGVRGARRRRSP